MNIGSGKYHPGGPTFNYKGGKFPCLVELSEGGGISGHILTNVLSHLDDLKLYDNDRKTVLFLHSWLMDMVVVLICVFKNTYVMKTKNGTLFLLFLMEHHCVR